MLRTGFAPSINMTREPQRAKPWRQAAEATERAKRKVGLSAFAAMMGSTNRESISHTTLLRLRRPGASGGSTVTPRGRSGHGRLLMGITPSTPGRASMSRALHRWSVPRNCARLLGSGSFDREQFAETTFKGLANLSGGEFTRRILNRGWSISVVATSELLVGPLDGSVVAIETEARAAAISPITTVRFRRSPLTLYDVLRTLTELGMRDKIPSEPRGRRLEYHDGTDPMMRGNRTLYDLGPMISTGGRGLTQMVARGDPRGPRGF